MKQFCKNCGQSYRINMGIYGVSDTHVQVCSHCALKINTLTGELHQTANDPAEEFLINNYALEQPKIISENNFQKSSQSLLSLFLVLMACVWGLYAGALVIFSILLGTNTGPCVHINKIYYILTNVIFVTLIAVSFFIIFLFLIKVHFRDKS